MGEAEAFTITALSPNAKYSFALKTQDQAGNWSHLSNVAVSDPAPAAVKNLAVRALTPFSVTLTWSAPGGDGTFGAAAEYDVRFSTSMIDEANWNEAVQVVGEPVPRNSMAAETLVINALVCNTIYYCALKTRDSPTTAWSLLSNVANSTTRTSPS